MTPFLCSVARIPSPLSALHRKAKYLPAGVDKCLAVSEPSYLKIKLSLLPCLRDKVLMTYIRQMAVKQNKCRFMAHRSREEGSDRTTIVLATSGYSGRVAANRGRDEVRLSHSFLCKSWETGMKHVLPGGARCADLGAPCRAWSLTVHSCMVRTGLPS